MHRKASANPGALRWVWCWVHRGSPARSQPKTPAASRLVRLLAALLSICVAGTLWIWAGFRNRLLGSNSGRFQDPHTIAATEVSIRLASEPQVAEAHHQRLRVLRAMTPEERLIQALELSDLVRALFEEGLRRRFPHLSESEFRSLYLQRLDLCHNRKPTWRCAIGENCVPD